MHDLERGIVVGSCSFAFILGLLVVGYLLVQLFIGG